MFNKLEWLFNVLLLCGVGYSFYVIGMAIYLISLGSV